jgi:hypothetical protein
VYPETNRHEQEIIYKKMNEFDRQLKRPSSNYIEPKVNKIKTDNLIKYIIYDTKDETKNKTARFLEDDLSASQFLKNVIILLNRT